MQFIVSRDNEQFGPYTLEQLHQYVNEGSIYPHDLVFDGQNWVNAVSYTHLTLPTICSV